MYPLSTTLPSHNILSHIAHAFEGGPADVRTIQERFINYFKGKETILDLGCGQGVFLELLREYGCQAEGVDFDPEIVALAQAKGLKVHCNDILSFLEHNHNKYDGIYAANIIEHFNGNDAVKIMQGCARALKPNGVLIILTANFRHPLMREEVFWLDITHVRPYPVPLLVKMMESIGLKIIDTGTCPEGLNDIYVIGARIPSPELCVIQEQQGGPGIGQNVSHQNSTLLWNAPIYDPSGYADEARNFVLSLDNHSIHLKINPVKWSNKEARLPQTMLERINKLSRTVLSSEFINIMHIFPPYFQRNPAARLNIGRTMFETDRIPEDWVAKCNEMDEIWVPTDFNLQTFAQAGVTPGKLFKIPGPHDFSGYSLDVPPLPIEGKKGFSFLSTFDWNLRKGWDILIKAYIEEFKEDEDVTLILKVWSSYGKVVTQLQQDVEKYIREVLSVDPIRIPDMLFLDLNIPVEEMPHLYKAVDAYVMPTRGEGWGRPYIEAMAMGLPTIGTRWSGNTEFMNDENSFLIDFEMVDVPGEGWKEVPTYKGHRWAEPSVSHLRSLMRHVYECRDEAREKGMHAREEVLKKYNRNVIAEKIIRHIGEFDRGFSSETHTPLRGTKEHKNVIPAQAGIQNAGRGLDSHFRGNDGHLGAFSNERPKISICWEGSQFVYHSLALINREVGIELLKKDQVELSIIPYESHQFDETADPRYPALARSFYKKLPSSDIHIRHQWPPNFNPPPDGRWVLIQPWEFGSLPKAWVPPIRNLIDEVWIPSHYVQQVYIDSGIDPERVHVIPNGINPEIFNPDGLEMKIHSRKGFKFLFVGGTIYRKGIDILINTYLKTFTAKDDVVLVIKDIGSKSFYSGQNLTDEIKKIRKNPKAPVIYYIEKDLSETEMASLYRACDCLVHPYRGEGFGLPVLEAMASGLPVIVTSGGSTDDFVDDNTGYRIQSRRTIFGNRDIGNLETVSDTWFLEIDRDSLQEKMQYVMTHPDEARTIGRNASHNVLREFTWQRVAEKYLERMHELLKKPILRNRT